MANSGEMTQLLDTGDSDVENVNSMAATDRVARRSPLAVVVSCIVLVCVVLLLGSRLTTGPSVASHRSASKINQAILTLDEEFTEEGTEDECMKCKLNANKQLACATLEDVDARKITPKKGHEQLVTAFTKECLGLKCMHGFDLPKWCNEGIDINCQTCKDNINVKLVCGTLQKVMAGDMKQEDGQEKLAAAFWKPSQCFPLPCMQRLGEELPKQLCNMDLDNEGQGEAEKTEQKPEKPKQSKNTTAVEAAGELLSNEEKLAQSLACQNVSWCGRCLTSAQCAGHAIEPQIFCCPRIKKCIDVRSRDTWGCPRIKGETNVCPNKCSERKSRQPNYPFDCGTKCPGWDPLTWVQCKKESGLPIKEEEGPSCISCKINIKKQKACKALYEGEVGILNRASSAKSIQESFWKPEECFKLDCMRDFNLPLFCKDEMMELANQNDGKGLEGIKALGAEAEIEKEAGLHEEGPSCISCTNNIDKQMACKALYEGTAGILNKTLAAKLIKESFWNPEECLKFDCMRDFNLPLFCKDEMMELANQHDGKGLEGIKALGVDAEIEKDAGLHEEGPSCTSCTSNINKQMACKALYKGEVGILNRASATKSIQESFWQPEECFKLGCMRDFNLPLFCKDEMMELANQNDGKGLEHIKALGVDAEIEKDAGIESDVSQPKKEKDETVVEAAGELPSNKLTLAQSLACRNVSLCGHCLTSNQCAGHATEPKIFCCPRIKKCIDVRSSDTWGCAGQIACPGKCSERRSRQPDYPLDCNTKCPKWDPLTWVQC